MPLRPRPTCAVCQHQPSKYACASCRADYCSVACYTRHRETCVSRPTGTETPLLDAPPPPVPSTPSSTAAPAPLTAVPHPAPEPEPAEPLQDPVPRRPLTSLNWPYVPDTSAFPDPLTRDDPKPLQLHHYDAIATSPAIRTLLASDRLRDRLTAIDALRGTEREDALQRALGVDSRRLKNDDAGTLLDDDTRALRALAEAVEHAVRGGREDALGLDWDHA